eukprot:TRINITY_DN7137_c0_g1_i1.p1 TRINITY_DN7137_c0_g1~~TRINITY_DN7137_c0_g1_i1.p1  ORF type:complete len:561 (+),score=125.06 TRINITY_DN7137_c0_g1_i1:34-1716(+)
MFSSRYLGEDEETPQEKSKELENAFEQRLQSKRTAQEAASRADDSDNDEDDEMQFEPLVAPKERFNKRSKRVRQTLPRWLANPIGVSTAINDETQRSVDDFDLQPSLAAALKRQGIATLFPIQAAVVPRLIARERPLTHPGDICICSPTGSGKTLSYVIPILNALSQRTRPRLQALIVLPTRQLVSQVFQVMSGLAGHHGLCDTREPLRVDVLSGQTSMAAEQVMLTKANSDIIIATPGRLVDHIIKTPGFDLQYVRYLVVDEADRLLTESYQNWTQMLRQALYKNRQDSNPTHLTPHRYITNQRPVQQILLSATLSRDPEKLEPLKLAFPTMIVANRSKGVDGAKGSKSTIPPQLDEFIYECVPADKPLALIYLLAELQIQRVLVFASSIDTTRRLALLLDAFGNIDLAEVSSNKSTAEIRRALRQFKEGKVQVLVCSDNMARGIDLSNVETVINYDAPAYPKTYIHRAGRAGRAGAHGEVYSLVTPTQIKHFQHLRRQIDPKELKPLDVAENAFDELMPRYQEALHALKGAINGKNDVEEAEMQVKEELMKQLKMAFA